MRIFTFFFLLAACTPAFAQYDPNADQRTADAIRANAMQDYQSNQQQAQQHQMQQMQQQIQSQQDNQPYPQPPFGGLSPAIR
jgi:hypothetical protein